VTANGVFQCTVLWLFPENAFPHLFITVGYSYNVGEWEAPTVKLLRFEINK